MIREFHGKNVMHFLFVLRWQMTGEGKIGRHEVDMESQLKCDLYC